MRNLRTGFFSLVVAVSAVAIGTLAWSGTAEAHDDCGCAPCAPRGTYARNCRHPSTRVLVGRGRGGCGIGYRGLRGGSWLDLRRGLGQGSFYDPTRRWVRDHYLRRFPFLHIAGEEAARMEVLLSEDLLLVMSEEQGKEAVLDTETRLDRAAARFFVADYEGAREDLKAVLADKPKEPRARWGLFLAAVCKSEWDEAGSHLKALAKAGEIKAGDRLEPEHVFANPKVYPAVIKGLRTLADLKITDGSIHAITAWSLASLGELDTAKRYVRMAKQWDADAAVTAGLEKMVSGKAPAPAPKAPAPKGPADEPKPKTNGDATFQAPQGPALHRQVADAAPKKRITYVEDK